MAQTFIIFALFNHCLSPLILLGYLFSIFEEFWLQLLRHCSLSWCVCNLLYYLKLAMLRTIFFIITVLLYDRFVLILYVKGFNFNQVVIKRFDLLPRAVSISWHSFYNLYIFSYFIVYYLHRLVNPDESGVLWKDLELYWCFKNCIKN